MLTSQINVHLGRCVFLILGLMILSCADDQERDQEEAGSLHDDGPYHLQFIQPARESCPLTCTLAVMASEAMTRVSYEFGTLVGEEVMTKPLGEGVEAPAFSITFTLDAPSTGWINARGFVGETPVVMVRHKIVIGQNMETGGEMIGGSQPTGGMEAGEMNAGMTAGVTAGEMNAGMTAGETAGENAGEMNAGMTAGETAGETAGNEAGGEGVGGAIGMGGETPLPPPGGHAHGMWLWYIEGTGMSHEQLARRLASSGYRRIYIKVADGGASCSSWTELCDQDLPQIYRNHGIEPWAWSYNYPHNVAAQADAIRIAEETGYAGYVLDIEVEFDRLTTELEELLSAFSQNHSPDFPMYVTTWGNPADHGMRVDIIDRYVDGHMPQTYLEVWGQPYMDRAAYWTEVGTCEYRSLGALKPIHHILSAEYDVIDVATIREVLRASGPETSIWRIPGEGTPLSIWTTLDPILEESLTYAPPPHCEP